MKFISFFHIFSVFGFGIFLSNCATYSGAESRQNVKQLTVGMSESKALDLLGTPDSVIKVNEITDRWIYEYKREAKKGHNLFVDFKNGEYIRSGELSGRDVAAAKEDSTPGTCTKWQNPEFVEESLCTQ